MTVWYWKTRSNPGATRADGRPYPPDRVSDRVSTVASCGGLTGAPSGESGWTVVLAFRWGIPRGARRSCRRLSSPTTEAIADLGTKRSYRKIGARQTERWSACFCRLPTGHCFALEPYLYDHFVASDPPSKGAGLHRPCDAAGPPSEQELGGKAGPRGALRAGRLCTRMPG